MGKEKKICLNKRGIIQKLPHSEWEPPGGEIITLYGFDKEALEEVMTRLAPALQGAGEALPARPHSQSGEGGKGLAAPRRPSSTKPLYIHTSVYVLFHTSLYIWMYVCGYSLS